MAIVGVLMEDRENFLVFQVTESVVRTLSDMKWSGSANWSVHSRHMGDALTEFTGLDPDQISFKIELAAELGVDPMKELTRLWTWQRAGTPLALTIGEHNYGRYRWSILSKSTAVQYTDGAGNLYACEVTLKLQEYLKR